MDCCCKNKDLIKIVKGDDTQVNGVHLLSVYIKDSVIDLTGATAEFILCGIRKEISDLSEGYFNIDYTSQETSTFPLGINYGALIFHLQNGAKTTIENLIAFDVVKVVHKDSILTKPYTLEFDVKLGEEKIFEISIQAGVSIEVAETVTLEPGSKAYVENVGTKDHLRLKFGIPEGEKGEEGQEGPAGKDALINGYNAIALVPGTGIAIETDNGTVIISNTKTSAIWGNIDGNIENQYDLMQKLNSKQNVINDLSEIRRGALLGSTALQPVDIINNTSSSSTDKALSAAMGKSLQDQVDNLKARGRFLALWNCSTGLAQSNPPESPYEYKTGDYFIVGTVASGSGTNYRPNGASYTTGVASTTVETEGVSVDDVYYYDGTNWRLQVNTQKTLAFANIAGNPYDNTELASALNDKQDELVQGTGIAIDSSTKTISNSGVRSVSTGSTAGTISVNTNGTSAEVPVAGLGTAAFTPTTDYATSAQGSLAESAVQPSDLSDYVTTNTNQDITATKTFKTKQNLQYGGGEGCLVIGADVTSNTVTANTRKLGRMSFHTNESTTLNCAFVSTDTQDPNTAATISNCVEFGGRTADTSNTSPDQIGFTVAKVHNSTSITDKVMALKLTKDGADFAVQPKYNGNDLVDVSTAQTITGQKTFTGSPVFQANNYETLIIKRNSQSEGALITYSNNSGVLARMGINGLEVPIHIPSSSTPIRALVRCGSQDSPTVGSTTQPVYIDSDGITQVCTGVQEKSTIQTLSATDSITLADNTIYSGSTQTSLTINLWASPTVDSVSEVVFASGATATTLTYPNIIKWLDGGTDVSGGTFTPDINKRYTIMFYYDGANTCAIVKGV